MNTILKSRPKSYAKQDLLKKIYSSLLIKKLFGLINCVSLQVIIIERLLYKIYCSICMADVEKVIIVNITCSNRLGNVIAIKKKKTKKNKGAIFSIANYGYIKCYPCLVQCNSCLLLPSRHLKVRGSNVTFIASMQIKK